VPNNDADEDFCLINSEPNQELEALFQDFVDLGSGSDIGSTLKISRGQ